MRALKNIFWGWMISLRALAIAAIPLSIVAGIYLSLTYFAWSHVFSSEFQHRHGEFTWLMSGLSLVVFVALTYGMHELGKNHRLQRA